MNELRKREKLIEEIDSPAFASGFFNGDSSLQKGTYNCKEALDRMKSEGYTVGRKEGTEFVLGWKYAQQIYK